MAANNCACGAGKPALYSVNGAKFWMCHRCDAATRDCSTVAEATARWNAANAAAAPATTN